MKIYAVGDLHLSFGENINKPMHIFGELWDDHPERVKAFWKSEIAEEDIVIVAGDISWAMKFQEAIPDLNWINSLPGRKVLLKGNHDLWWKSITKLNSLYEGMFFLQNQHYQAETIGICGTRGWICPETDGFSENDEKIYRRELLRLELSLESALRKGVKEIIGVLHFPPTSNGYVRSGFTDLFESAGVKQVVYGHLHGERAFAKGIRGAWRGVKYNLVSLDYLDCKPLLLRDSIK